MKASRPAVVIWPGSSQALIAAPQRPKLSPSRCAPQNSRAQGFALLHADDAARLGIVEVNAIAESHVLESPDPAAKTAGEDHDLADLTLRLRCREHVLVEDVGRGDGVVVGKRWIAVVGAEGVENSLGALRGGEPRRDPRFDRRPI